jgi:hypothetical protein
MKNILKHTKSLAEVAYQLPMLKISIDSLNFKKQVINGKKYTIIIWKMKSGEK